MEDIQNVIDAISKERGIEKERVELALKRAFEHTAKQIIDQNSAFRVDFSTNSPIVYEIFRVFGNGFKAKKEREFDNRRDSKKRENRILYKPIRLDDAIKQFPDQSEKIRIGDELELVHDFAKFKRNGHGVLYKNIEKNLEEFKGNSLYFSYKSKIGEKISGKVIHIDETETTIIDINDEDVKAVIRKRDRIKGESYKIGQWISAVVKYVKIEKEDSKINLELSRTSPKYLEALFSLSVPEVKDGVVNIHSIARIPGERAKVAVSSNNPKVDAISAVIGSKGSRVNSVSAEVHGEAIDCISYNYNPEQFVKNSLSPAVVESVKLTDEDDEDGYLIKVAYVSLVKEERGKAIGKNGVNLKLAKMLTGFDIRLLIVEGSSSTEFTPRKQSADKVLGALFS
jgi:N utilization substance protein A